MGTSTSLSDFRSDGSFVPELCGGEVRFYNPESDTYTVAIDGRGDVDSIRSMQIGAYRPYRATTRVLCVRVKTIQWMIVGAVPQFQPGAKEKKSPEGAVEEKDKKFREAVGDRYQIFAASAKKAGYGKLFEGDVVLDNAKDSFIKILENGDIFGLASYFCFFLFSAVYSLIFLKARDLIFDVAGFLFTVETNTEVKRAALKIDVSNDQSKDADPDFSIRAGDLGGQNLFDMEAQKLPSESTELSPTSTGISGLAGGLGGLGGLTDSLPIPDIPPSVPVGSTSVTDAIAGATGSPPADDDPRRLWWLLGEHSLLEVDNESREVRLSRVDVQRDDKTKAIINSEQETKQLRLNDDEIAIQWEDRWVTVNKARASVSYGNNYISVDDKAASMKFGDNSLIINEYGIQITGFLELVGGKIKLVGKTVDAPVDVDLVASLAPGVQPQAMPNVEYKEEGIIGELALTMDMKVNEFALVNENFFKKYDLDQSLIVKSHQHMVVTEGAPTTPFPGSPAPSITPGSLVALDDPLATSDNVKKLTTTVTQ